MARSKHPVSKKRAAPASGFLSLCISVSAIPLPLVVFRFSFLVQFGRRRAFVFLSSAHIERRVMLLASVLGLDEPSRVQTSRKRGAPPTTGTVVKRKKHHFKPGTVALWEIRHLQKTWNHLIPAAQFIRAVKEISNQLATQITRWQAEASVAIQEKSSSELACSGTIHAKRVTLMKKDFELARRIGGKGRPCAT